MSIRWTPSAAKHGVNQADALNAIELHVYWLRAFDEPRFEGGLRPDLWIGPNRSRTQLIEVLAEVTPPADLLIFHVMEARRKC
ncbi:hypothetical protein GCM10011399_06100 [Subtercola lobariae]|uniref:Uncharacterized protein n=1 Tax=Subtercola lobariae TaxID=1588641 RepID=A0A917B260_9MICO|nr:hypothetical protein GCM10011399_06100 [Subtercola lobariae]